MREAKIESTESLPPGGGASGDARSAEAWPGHPLTSPSLAPPSALGHPAPNAQAAWNRDRHESSNDSARENDQPRSQPRLISIRDEYKGRCMVTRVIENIAPFPPN
jgi:hypothetical protein